MYYAIETVSQNGKVEIKIMHCNDLPEYDIKHPFVKNQLVLLKGRNKNKVYGTVVNSADEKGKLLQLMASDSNDLATGKASNADQDEEGKRPKNKRGRPRKLDLKDMTDKDDSNNDDNMDKVDDVKKPKTDSKFRKRTPASAKADKDKNKNSREKDEIQTQGKGDASGDEREERKNDDLANAEKLDSKTEAPKNSNSAAMENMQKLIEEKEKEIEDLKAQLQERENNEDFDLSLNFTKHSRIVPGKVEPLVKGGKLLIDVKFKNQILAQRNDEKSITSCLSQIMAETYTKGPAIGKYCARGINKTDEEEKLALPHTDELIEFCRLIEEEREKRALEKDQTPKEPIMERDLISAINMKIVYLKREKKTSQN